MIAEHGARIRVGTTQFAVERTPLVLCGSGVPAAEKLALKAACEKLGVVLLKEWREDVTHLVMPQCARTPKFLTALMELVPVVNPAWVAAAAARTAPTDPLPDVHDAVFAPAPAAAGAAANLPPDCAHVKPSRRTLFEGWKIICLPPEANTSAAAVADSRRTLQKMGVRATPEQMRCVVPHGGDATLHRNSLVLTSSVRSLSIIVSRRRWPCGPRRCRPTTARVWPRTSLRALQRDGASCSEQTR